MAAQGHRRSRTADELEAHSFVPLTERNLQDFTDTQGKLRRASYHASGEANTETKTAVGDSPVAMVSTPAVEHEASTR